MFQMPQRTTKLLYIIYKNNFKIKTKQTLTKNEFNYKNKNKINNC